MSDQQLHLEGALSYSSAVLLQNCEQRFAHYKVYQTPNDPDFEEDSEALVLGKIFHEILEKTMHGERDLVPVFKSSTHNLEPKDKSLLEAMTAKYLKLHRHMKLKAHTVEFEIKRHDFIGYVDVVLTDKDNNFWIGDIKTSARLGTTVVSRLPMDFQLNLYSYFHTHIASELGLGNFLGARYRLTTKAKLVKNGKESWEDYTKRLLTSIKSYDIPIPRERLNMNEAWDRHQYLYNRSLDLRNGELPKKNLSYCDSYFKPCPYWSKCHGRQFTELSESLEIFEE